MPAIGIDLGTTYSCVAVIDDGEIKVLPNKNGNYTTPSCVAFTEARTLVGEDAKDNLSDDPKNTIFNIKRMIGLRSNNPIFMNEKGKLPFDIIDKDNDIKIKVSVNGQTECYLPEEISGKVLLEMKNIAEEYLGETVVDAVITVPARFNTFQKKKTREAAEYANLNVLQLLHEPTAAALAYGFQHEGKRDGWNVLVYDLGGGTFDVSVLSITKDCYKVKGTAGSTHLGGEDFDELMVSQCIIDFNREHSIDLKDELKPKFRLRRACEKTKIALSTVLDDEVQVNCLHDDLDFRRNFTRAKFESLAEDCFNETLEHIDHALEDARLSRDQIDEIVIVGGSSRIPYVQTMLRKHFKKQVCKALNPDEAIARGAAILAANIAGVSIAPDKHFNIKDVIPLSLGVRTKGGVMSIIIKRNTEFPTDDCSYYTSVADYQTSINFCIYEGERAKVELNHQLGSLKINIPSQLAGKPHIKVTFDIDIDGILHVTALDTETKLKTEADIEWEKKCKPKEEAAMEVIKAEEYKKQDEEWKNDTFARNKLEAKALKLKRLSNDLPRQRKQEVSNKCDQVLLWLDSNQEATSSECQVKDVILDSCSAWFHEFESRDHLD